MVINYLIFIVWRTALILATTPKRALTHHTRFHSARYVRAHTHPFEAKPYLLVPNKPSRELEANLFHPRDYHPTQPKATPQTPGTIETDLSGSRTEAKRRRDGGCDNRACGRDTRCMGPSVLSSLLLVACTHIRPLIRSSVRPVRPGLMSVSRVPVSASGVLIQELRVQLWSGRTKELRLRLQGEKKAAEGFDAQDRLDS